MAHKKLLSRQKTGDESHQMVQHKGKSERHDDGDERRQDISEVVLLNVYKNEMKVDEISLK